MFTHNGTRRDFLIAFRTASGENPCAPTMGQLHGRCANSPRPTLHEDSAPRNGARYVNGPMRGDAGNSQTGTLLK